MRYYGYPCKAEEVLILVEGWEIGEGREGRFSMMYPIASEVEVNSDHLITFKLNRRYPIISEENYMTNNVELLKVSSEGEADYRDSILNISEERNGSKIYGWKFELKFDEEDFDDDVIFVLTFELWWGIRYGGVISVSMRPV